MMRIEEGLLKDKRVLALKLFWRLIAMSIDNLRFVLHLGFNWNTIRFLFIQEIEHLFLKQVILQIVLLNITSMDWKNKPHQIFNKVKNQMFAKGVQSFYFVDCFIKDFDPNYTCVLNSHWLNLFLNKVGVFLTTQQIRNIKDLYSKSKDEIAYRDFLEDIKYSISQKIACLINDAFCILDPENTRQVSLEKIISCYNAAKHPHVLSRKKSPETVLEQFIKGITRKSKDDVVRKQAFVDYYAELNFCIPVQKQSYFAQLLTGVWNIVNSEEYVSPKRMQQIEHCLYEKIREKSDGKTNEWKTAKKTMAYFDLEDKGFIDYCNFKRALDKFGCNFKEKEMKAIFCKFDANQNGKLEYEQFSKMIMDIDISGLAKKQSLLTTMGSNHFKVTH